MSKYLNIDTTDKVDTVTKIILESEVYILRLRYSNRAGWQMSLYDYELYTYDKIDNSSALLCGERKLVAGQDFLKYSKTKEGLPTGYLYLLDTNMPNAQNYEEPTRYNLGQGKRFVLIYFTSDEIDTIVAGG